MITGAIYAAGITGAPNDEGHSPIDVIKKDDSDYRICDLPEQDANRLIKYLEKLPCFSVKKISL